MQAGGDLGHWGDTQISISADPVIYGCSDTEDPAIASIFEMLGSVAPQYQIARPELLAVSDANSLKYVGKLYEPPSWVLLFGAEGYQLAKLSRIMQVRWAQEEWIFLLFHRYPAATPSVTGFNVLEAQLSKSLPFEVIELQEVVMRPLHAVSLGNGSIRFTRL